jgi:hypothetical protein
VDGDIAAPRVAIAEGAHFRGSIDMQRAGVKGDAPKTEAPKAAPAPAQGAGSPAQGGGPQASSSQPAPAGAQR